MSFSGKVKEELAEQISAARHCRIAELAAILSFCGEVKKDEILLHTDHPAVVRKYFTLLKKTFNIERALGSEEMQSVIKAVTGPSLTQKSCCRRAYLRGAFFVSGSVNDPDKSYHLEIACKRETQAQELIRLLQSFEIDARMTLRKNYPIVYLKEGAQIVDTLNVIGAHVALMDYENSRIIKDMRNSVNRRVNCETANIGKTVSAFCKQMEDIRIVKASGAFKELPEGLRAVAKAREEHPNATLKELGELMDPPVGKSGVNHRLRKLSELADRLGSKEE